MILEILLFVLLILAAYTLFRISHQWISPSKILEGPDSKVKIKINSDLDTVKFSDGTRQDLFEFERKNLKRGEILEFVYPAFDSPIEIVAIKKGEKKVFKIEISH